jgi:hypothetical protein
MSLENPKRLGDTITFTMTTRDVNGALADPASWVINLYDPNGTLKAGPLTSPTKVSLGVFTQKITIPTAVAGGLKGIWGYEVKATFSDGDIKNVKYNFEVDP